MSGASYLWRRGSTFWFQIAIPKNLALALGRTPLRIRLPARNHHDASRYARVLAGAVERWFVEMGRSTLWKLGVVSGAPGARDTLLKAMLAEIQDIAAPRDALAERKSPDRSSESDLIADLRKRNAVLEGLVVALRDKARELATEYADFVGDTARHYRRLQAQEEADEIERECEEEAWTGLKSKLADKSQEAEEARVQLEGLKEQIVAGGAAQLSVLDKVVETMAKATAAIDETAIIKEINKDLQQRLDYKGPLLSESIEDFLADRRNRGVAEKEIATFRQKLKDFIDLIGDKPVGAYSIGDLQRFGHKLTFLPERHKIDRRWREIELADVIAIHEKARQPRTVYLCEKTILTNYVGRIKTAIRWITADNKVDYPFANAGNIAVLAHGESVVRHGLPYESVNKILACASASPSPEEIWLPLLGLLTGARLGELIYIQPTDIRQHNGCWIIDLTGQISHPGRNSRRPLKTGNSRRYIVLHKFFEQTGFIEWAMDQKDWIFPSFHYVNDKNNEKIKRPTNAASKRFQRLFKEWGLTQSRVEVFHALRHTYKDWCRSQKVEERTIALQTGHSLQGVALQYGTKVLRSDEMRRLAELDPEPEWRLGYYVDLTKRAECLNQNDGFIVRRKKHHRRRKVATKGEIAEWIG